MKNSKNNNIILSFGFSFMYLVSVDAKDRSYVWSFIKVWIRFEKVTFFLVNNIP